MSLSDREWFEMMFPGQTYVAPGTATLTNTQPVPVTTPPIIQTENTDMDLGNLLGDLGTAYIQARYSQPAQPQVQPAALDFDIPFVDVVPQNPGAGPASDSCGGQWVYKKHCGQYKWVKVKRRRRKRLATRSDLRDLAALKGVLGQGKAFETWIATHS